MPRESKDATGPRGKGQFSSKGYRQTRSKQERGRYLPTFSHTRTHTKMTAYDDTDYVVVALKHFIPTVYTGLENLAKDIVYQGHTAGHMKDKVDAEETAYAANAAKLLAMILDLRYQYNIKNLFADIPTADETGTSASAIAIWDDASWNNMMTEYDGKDIAVPNWIIKIADELSFYFQMSDEYLVGTVRTPPSYFVPYTSDQKLTEIQALNVTVYGNNSLAKLYMDKFKVGYTKLSTSLIEKDLTLYQGVHNSKALAFFCHEFFQVYDNGGAHSIERDGSIHDDDLTSRKYYFIDKPDEDILHVLAPLLESYVDADTCYFGAFGQIHCGADDDDISMIKADFIETTAWVAATVTNCWFMLQHYAALYQQGAGHSQGDTSGWLNMSLTGTKLAADIDLGDWPLAVSLKAFSGTGLTETIANNALLNFCIANAF